jgi:hypothetical protein
MKVVVDHERGCGWRKPGGLYLISGGVSVPCGKLPVELSICPCCSQGIKPTRGWTWINASLLVKAGDCGSGQCAACPLFLPPVKAGLMWIGGIFYATPGEFTEEAARLGVSRRIHAVPKDFKVGETWVFIAHRKAIQRIEDGKVVDVPGIFHAFKPTEVQYVVKGDETPEELAALEKRGITPVIVKRADEQQEMTATA